MDYYTILQFYYFIILQLLVEANGPLYYFTTTVKKLAGRYYRTNNYFQQSNTFIMQWLHPILWEHACINDYFNPVTCLVKLLFHHFQFV